MSERDSKLLELALELGRLEADGTTPSERSHPEPIDAEALAVAGKLASLASDGGSPPPSSLRDRVLASVKPEHRYEGFVDRLALLLDWPTEDARALLRDGTDPTSSSWLDGPAEGIRVRTLEAGDAHGPALAGLVWCAPGSEFPAHRHHGTEWALVLEGGAINSGGEHWAVGDYVRQSSDSTHSFRIPSGDVPLLAAVVVRVGLELV